MTDAARKPGEAVDTFEHNGVGFTLYRSDKVPVPDGQVVFELRAQGEEYGAVIVQSGPTVQVRIVAPARWHNDARWRKARGIRRQSVAPEIAARDAAQKIFEILNDMRFDDPLVEGDPLEAKASKYVQAKVAALRRLAQRQAGAMSQLTAELRTGLYGPAGDESLVFVAQREDGALRPLPADSSVVLRAASSDVWVRLVDGQVQVTAEHGGVSVVPVSANRVRIATTP